MENMINESIVEGRKFRQLIDKESKNWKRISGWIITDRPFQLATPINNTISQKEK